MLGMQVNIAGGAPGVVGGKKHTTLEHEYFGPRCPKGPHPGSGEGLWPAVISVELRGLEPLTPSLRTRCATSCATAPWCGRNNNTEATPSPKPVRTPMTTRGLRRDDDPEPRRAHPRRPARQSSRAVSRWARRPLRGGACLLYTSDAADE